MLRASKCRSCEAPIVWVRTAASDGRKSMPLDVEPSDNGNVTLDEATGRARVHADHATARTISERTYMPHWATCEHADDHRPTR